MIEIYYPSYFQAEVSVVAKLKEEIEALIHENRPDSSDIPENRGSETPDQQPNV